MRSYFSLNSTSADHVGSVVVHSIEQATLGVRPRALPSVTTPVFSAAGSRFTSNPSYHSIIAFVLFFFLSRLYAFAEAAALRSIILRYACVPTATHVFLPLFYLFLEVPLIPNIFVP